MKKYNSIFTKNSIKAVIMDNADTWAIDLVHKETDEIHTETQVVISQGLGGYGFKFIGNISNEIAGFHCGYETVFETLNAAAYTLAVAKRFNLEWDDLDGTSGYWEQEEAYWNGQAEA